MPATTLDRQCGSSQQAAHFAAQGVIAGAYDVVIACGVESMSRVPMFSAQQGRDPYGTRLARRYPDGLIQQGVSAELVAAKWGLDRDMLDEFALRSHQRAANAAASGAFDNEIVPVTVPGEDGSIVEARADETVRGTTTLERLAHLKPAFASVPEAARAGLDIDAIDAFEVNEAFASVPLAWQRELGVDHERVNMRGGAIALGHPLGASGTRLLTTLLGVLESTGGRYGLQTMCEGGGMANATLIERL